MRVRRALARLCGRDARAPGLKPTPVSPPPPPVIPAKAGIQRAADVSDAPAPMRQSSFIKPRNSMSTKVPQ